MSPFDLRHGDCLEIMARLPNESVDMILCDLPYGTTACKWDAVIPFDALWAQYRRVIRPGGAIVLTASQPFTSALVMSNPGWFKYDWTWRKTVLDNCMGSGTTGVACANTGRNFIGIERDDKYFAVSSERIAKAYSVVRLP